MNAPAPAPPGLLRAAAVTRRRLNGARAAVTEASAAAAAIALELHDLGWTEAVAATAVGLSRQLVGQLVRDRIGEARPVGRPRLSR